VVLADLFALWRQHEDFNHAHPAAVLEAMALNRGGVAAALDELATRELAKKSDAGWTLTPEGLRVAQALHSERVDPDSFQKEGAL
jgi:Mn-dependent DtxR family transcriptional regulator